MLEASKITTPCKDVSHVGDSNARALPPDPVRQVPVQEFAKAGHLRTEQVIELVPQRRGDLRPLGVARI
jgi:hypothetical protein